MHNSILYNIITLLKAGAFTPSGRNDRQGKRISVMPMSKHKWREVAAVAGILDIADYIRDGAKMIEDETQRETCVSITGTDTSRDDKAKPALPAPELFNHWTQKRLDAVREEEMNAHDTSEHTLELLDLIVANANAIVSADVSIKGIVELGRYIRKYGCSTTEGDARTEGLKKDIDWEKLRAWLSTVGLVQTANLEGNMLVSCFDFSEEELPFVKKPYHSAEKIFMHSLSNALKKHSCNSATRMNVALLETVSHRFFSMISMVTDIEE